MYACIQIFAAQHVHSHTHLELEQKITCHDLYPYLSYLALHWQTSIQTMLLNLADSTASAAVNITATI